MPFRDYFSRIADNKRPTGAFDAGLQGVLGAVAPLYGGGAYMNRFLYESGLKQRRRLPVPVVSVGNITLGGTGKTPFCIWLIDWLKKEGRTPTLLTRGYGRDDEDRLTVVRDGKELLATTREAGDEPVMLARALEGVPVLACANRYRAGRLAIRRYHADTIVLDDGFQHHALERQADIVLVDSMRRLSSLSMFPRGTLREPLSVLSRANLIVLTRWNQARKPEAVLREVRRHAPHVPVVRANLEVQGLEWLRTGEALSKEEYHRRRAYLFCAVGNPQSVRATAKELGLRVAGYKALDDHARLSRENVLKADMMRAKAKADLLVVTEKDAVKLRELGVLPTEIAVMKTRLSVPEEKDQRTLQRVLEARLRGHGLRGFLAAK